MRVSWKRLRFWMVIVNIMVLLCADHRGHASRFTKLEVSGGVTLATVRAIAKTGVERISIGRLTHSAPSLDLSLQVTYKCR